MRHDLLHLMIHGSYSLEKSTSTLLVLKLKLNSFGVSFSLLDRNLIFQIVFQIYFFFDSLLQLLLGLSNFELLLQSLAACIQD